MAGTQLRGIFGALSAPTRQSEKLLQQLASRIGETADVFDLTKESADGSTPALIRVFNAFRQAGTTASEFFTIFGRRQAAGAIVLSQFVDNVETLTAANEDAEGEARRLAEIMEDTLPGAFRSLRSAVEGAALEIGEQGFGGALRATVDFTTQVIRALFGIGEEFENLPLSVRVVTSVIKGLAAAAAAFAAVKLGGAIIAAGSALLAFATGPVGIVLVAISAIVAALVFFKDEMIEIGDLSVSVGDIVAVAWELVSERIGATFRVLVAIGRRVFEALKEVAVLLFDVFKMIFFDPILNVMKQFGITWEDLFKGLVDAVKSALNTAIGIVVGFFNFFQAQVGEFARIFSALVTFDITSPVESASRIKEALGDALDPGELARDAAKAFTDSMGQDYVGAITAFLENNGDFIRRVLDQEFGEGFTDDLNLVLNPLATIDSAIEKLRQRSEQRRAAGQATGSDTPGVPSNDDIDKVQDMLNQVKLLGQQVSETEQEFIEFSDTLRRDVATAIEELLVSPDEFEIAQAMRDIDEAAAKAGVSAQSLKEEIRDQLENLQTLRRVRELAEDIGDAFGDAFTDVLFGAKTAGEAALAFAETVSRALVERLVVQPLVDFLTNLIVNAAASVLGITAGASAASSSLISAGAVSGASIAAGGQVAAASLTAAAVRVTAAAAALAAARAGSVVVASRRGLRGSGHPVPPGRDPD